MSSYALSYRLHSCSFSSGLRGSAVPRQDVLRQDADADAREEEVVEELGREGVGVRLQLADGLAQPQDRRGRVLLQVWDEQGAELANVLRVLDFAELH